MGCHCSRPLSLRVLHRAVAFGFATGGSGGGGLVFSLTTRAAIQNLGIKWAYIINGLISLVVLVPACFLMKARIKKTEGGWQPLQLSWFLQPAFALTFGWASLSMIGYIIGLFTLPTFATQALGLSQSQGAAVQAVLSAAQMIGRPAVGLTLDYAGRLNMAIIATTIAGLAPFFIWYALVFNSCQPWQAFDYFSCEGTSLTTMARSSHSLSSKVWCSAPSGRLQVPSLPSLWAYTTWAVH